jgi:hypothetical protein
MSVVQHKSAQTTAQSLTVTLDSQVTSGNLIIAVIGYSGFGGQSIADFNHDSNPSTFFQQVAERSTAFIELQVWFQQALLSEAYSLKIDFSVNDSQGKQVHLYEVSGYDSFDTYSTAVATTNAPSVTLGQNTKKANEFVLGAFTDVTHIGESFTAGSGYTAVETTGANSFSMFSEYKTISSVGQPTASASIPNTDVVISVIVTFYNSSDSGGGGNGGGGNTGQSTTFLGSVRVVGSAPFGLSNPFLGTVKVVDSAPSGPSNPYLGHVVIGSPSGSQSDPSLGEVVVVDSGPIGVPDPFLGTASEM